MPAPSRIDPAGSRLGSGFGVALDAVVVYTICLRLTWDPRKAASNLAKHGVAFEAVDGFEWEAAIVAATLAHPGGEPRLLAVGPIGDRLHVLVFSVDRREVRIISLRKANNREIDRYEAAD